MDTECPVCELWPVGPDGLRCRTCRRYYERHGQERPRVLIERDRARAYHAHQGAVWDKVGSKVQVLSIGCWTWTGKTKQVRLNGHVYSVGRLLFGVLRGPVSDSARLVRRCGTEACVNPDHMDLRIRS